MENSCLGQEGRRSKDKFSGPSAGSQAVAHAECPGEAVRGETGVSEGEKRGGKLVT